MQARIILSYISLACQSSETDTFPNNDIKFAIYSKLMNGFNLQKILICVVYSIGYNLCAKKKTNKPKKQTKIQQNEKQQPDTKENVAGTYNQHI